MGASPSCAFCGASLGAREAAEGTTCFRRACLAEQALIEQRDDEARRDAADQQAANSFAAARLGPGEFAARIPSADAPLAPADPDRQRRFRQKLRESLRDAVKAAAAARVDDSPGCETGGREAAHLEAVCGLCRGACCYPGGTHAFLLSGFMTGVLRRRSSETPAQIYRDYVRRLPDESCEGSCVYHGATGCALPRRMRSEVCNTHECRLRGRLAVQWDRADSKRMMAVSVSGGRVRAAARIGDGTAREIYRED